MIIRNAANVPLNLQTQGTMPDVSGALFDWFQQITFTSVSKSVQNFQAVEVGTSFSFEGTWQPFTDRQLVMKPEGERKWKWFLLHSQPNVPLIPDDVITYLGVQYRVKAMKDWSLNGYMEYHLIEDYTGAGPS